MGNRINEGEITKLAAEVAAKTALEVYEKERKNARKEQIDRRLRNTKLLLRNFRMFREHAAKAVYEIEMADENAYEILDLMEQSSKSIVFVDSIKTSVARTVTIVHHIEAMLEIYEIFCQKSTNPEEKRRYRVIRSLYIDDKPLTIKAIAEEEHMTERNVYRDIDIACERLASLFFGIDGINRY